MADYYPLIARAIAGLDPSAPGESRRALYERARSALIAQLRSVQPPLSESEITRERLSLEEAARKGEPEPAQRARDASRPAGAARSSSGDAFRRANARPPESGPSSLDQPAPNSPALRPRPPAPTPRAPPPAPPAAAAARPPPAARPGRSAALSPQSPSRYAAAAPAAAATADAG